MVFVKIFIIRFKAVQQPQTSPNIPPQKASEPFAITTTINGDSYDELIKIVWQREFNQLFCQLPEKPIGKWNFYESAQAKDDGQGIVLRDWAKVSFIKIFFYTQKSFHNIK